MGMTLTKGFVNNCRNIGALRDFLCQAMDQVDEKDKEIAELKEKLESEKASRYADSVDAGMRERRLKRALWLMGAERYSYKEKLARECACLNSYEDWNRFLKRKRTYEKWIDQLIRIAKLCEKLKTKCRAMAEKFGG